MDTGAEAIVLPLNTFKSMKRKARRERRAHLQLQPTKTVLVAYGGMRLRPEGLLTLTCSTPKAHASLPFYILRHSSRPILGGNACEDLHLIKRLDINNLDVKLPTTKEELIACTQQCLKVWGSLPENNTSTQTPRLRQSYTAAEKYHWP